LTLQQDCKYSSLAAIRATHPSVMLFRYNNGVFPINFTINQTTKVLLFKKTKHRDKEKTLQP